MVAEYSVVELVTLRKSRPASVGEITAWIPGRAANRLGHVMNEAADTVEERAIEVLPVRPIREPLQLGANLLQDLRQLGAQLGFGTKRSRQRLRLQRRDAHLIALTGTTHVRRFAAKIVGGLDEPSQLTKKRRPNSVKLVQRRSQGPVGDNGNTTMLPFTLILPLGSPPRSHGFSL